ncbi:MAG: Ig-like domain-containing protein [Planctomycetota bacterium]
MKRSLKGRYWRKVITYFLTCCMFFNTTLPAVMAGPEGGTPDFNGGGAISITYDTGDYNNTTLVNVLTTRSVIRWDSLDTAGGPINERETLKFTQDTLSGTLSNSAVLNRVSGAATQFNGDLVAPDMRIFMVNPAGVVFGEGATIDTTQLVASGLNMSNDAFNAYLDDPVNNMMEFVGGDGDVINRASITADRVYLIGKKVWNVGPIVADEGVVVMAAGDEVRLLENGSNVSVVVSDLGDGEPDIINSNVVRVDDGTIVLAAGDLYSRAIRNVSFLAAEGGTVELKAASVQNRGYIDASASTEDGDAGSISLIGAEEIVLSGVSKTTANADLSGDGGTITLESGTETDEGMITMEEGSLISANGGSELNIDEEAPSGGQVTITSDNFEIAGAISASPGNKIYEPGTLEINTKSVIIADGASTGETNTLYEDDIEALSQGATNLVVNAEADITVRNITDAIGNGEITGQFGDIVLNATGEDGSVKFDNGDDTIRTTLGDIIVEAGSGGITVGNLITGKDLAEEKPAPGQIFLTTNNRGDITTGDLIIEDGWRHAEINVKSDNDLTVNGDVKVGSESAINNVPLGEDAEAMIYLMAADNVVLNGDVCANAYGAEEGNENSVTKASIKISSGTNQNLTGDAEINGDLEACATASSNGTSEATIEVDAFGDIIWGPDTDVIAEADNASVTGKEDAEDEDQGNVAQIIINAQDYPTPPPIGIPDTATTPKSETVPLDVLANDQQVDQETGEIIPLEFGIITDYTQPKTTAGDPPAEVDAGSLTVITQDVGDGIIGFEYNPPEDLSVLEFNENGEATVTFTYVVMSQGEFSEPTPVTITLTNGLPVAVEDKVATTSAQSVTFDVLVNDTDPDLEDFLTAVLQGDVTTKNGTLVTNEDGTFTYTPNEGYVGDDSFTYAATDSHNTSSVVNVKISVGEGPGLVMPLGSISPAPGLNELLGVN